MDEPFVPVVKETLLSRSPAKGSGGVAAGSVLLILLVSGIYWSNLEGLARYLPATYDAVFEGGEYWRLLTSIAAHADLRHFFANAIVFGVLCYLLFGYFGPLVYPALTLVLGCAVTAASLSTYPAGISLVGASGVVYQMAAFWLVLYLFLERRLSVGKRLLRASGFGLIALAPTTLEPAVSYRTHALGFAAGALLGVIYFLWRHDALRSAERIEWE